MAQTHPLQGELPGKWGYVWSAMIRVANLIATLLFSYLDLRATDLRLDLLQCLRRRLLPAEHVHPILCKQCARLIPV